MSLKLRARTTVPAPQALCWDRLVDVDSFLHKVTPPHVRLSRVSGAGPAEVGSAWEVALNLAGQDHIGQMRLVDLSDPESCRLEGGTDAVALGLHIALSRLSDSRTGLAVTLEAAPLGLGGRVILAPMKVMRPALEARLRNRVDWVVERAILAE